LRVRWRAFRPAATAFDVLQAAVAHVQGRGRLDAELRQSLEEDPAVGLLDPGLRRVGDRAEEPGEPERLEQVRQAVVPVADHSQPDPLPRQLRQDPGRLRVDLPGGRRAEAMEQLRRREPRGGRRPFQLAQPLQEPPPPAALPLRVRGEPVVPRIGAAGELLPDGRDQPPGLLGVQIDAVTPEDLGVDLAETRAVDQGVGDVEGDRPDHGSRIPEKSPHHPGPSLLPSPPSLPHREKREKSKDKPRPTATSIGPRFLSPLSR
jgi:hypothetical protein